MKLFVHKVGDDNFHILCLSAATDGRLALWDVTNTFKAHIVSLKKHEKQETNDSYDESVRNVPLSVTSEIGLKEDDNLPGIANIQDGNHSDDLCPVFVTKCQQSGINALDILQCSGKNYLFLR